MRVKSSLKRSEIVGSKVHLPWRTKAGPRGNGKAREQVWRQIKIPVKITWTEGLWRTYGGGGQHLRKGMQWRCDQGKEMELK